MPILQALDPRLSARYTPVRQPAGRSMHTTQSYDAEIRMHIRFPAVDAAVPAVHDTLAGGGRAAHRGTVPEHMIRV